MKKMIAVFALAAALLAQQSPISYVSSVKLNTAVEPRGFSEYSPGGRLTANATTVAALVRVAYRVQGYQIVGLPEWARSKRYDISAKADDSPAPSQQALVQAFLRDRFQMEAHQETREMPVFALVTARSDNRLGAKLTPSSFDCAAYMAGPHPPPQPGKTPTCATRIGLGVMYGNAIPMSTLASSLAPFAGRYTIDKTGLKGGYDVELMWTPDNLPANLPDPPDPNGPSLFTALQEQLGLKLVTDKAPAQVLVIDRLQQPTEN